MHPSRLVALCFLCVSVLLLARLGVAAPFQFTTGTTLHLVGGIVLLASSLYGLVRYEENPVVTEYGPLTYLLVLGASLWAVGLAVQLLAA